MSTAKPPVFGALILGDEILSGRRSDKHLPKLIEMLQTRGLSLAYVHVLGDDPSRITQQLRQLFATADVVFSFGGIGATPDDHTRQCAAAALGQPLELHPGARDLINQRMQEVALQQGKPFDPEQPDNVHRLNMGVFPSSATLIHNPYNKIPGFSCSGSGGGRVHFVPGFPVMAWPMVAAVLDAEYAEWFAPGAWVEKSVVVYGAMEATLTPLMEQIERDHAGIKVFSLPSVDHPVHGKHIELGVKGAAASVDPAYTQLLNALNLASLVLGPEMVQ
jgi:molybdopterin-biosynthesis enzyme MoeA-like protein